MDAKHEPGQPQADREATAPVHRKPDQVLPGDPSPGQGADVVPRRGAGTDPVLAAFWAAVRRLPRYVRLAANLATDPRVPKQAKTALAVGGAYTVSPIDLVPGLIPVAGQLDDLFVLLFVVRRALRACPPGVAEEHLDRVTLSATNLDDDLAAVRGTARWLGGKALRAGGRLAKGTGRLLWSAIRR